MVEELKGEAECRELLPVTLIVQFCSIIQDFKRKSVIFVRTYANLSL
jgi:hypothetical protein